MTTRVRITLELADDRMQETPDGRVDQAVNIAIQFLDRLADDFQVDHCTLYGAATASCVSLMLENQHLECAARAAQEIGLMVAQAEQEEHSACCATH